MARTARVGGTARTPARGIVILVLLGLALMLGTAVGTAAGTAPGTAPGTERGRDPYGHGGLLVPLPGGGHVRLVRPGPRAPSAPPRATAGKPRVTLPDLPVPVLGPLFPVAVPSPTAPAAVPPAPKPSRSSGPAAASPRAYAGGSDADTPYAGGSDAYAAVPPAGHGPGQAWLPLGQGPPPLEPQALAAPLPAAGLQAAPLPTAAGSQAARWEHKRRLLPLGVGLALIGGGAALFGWRLRRP